MEEEILVSGAVVFRTRGGKTLWLLVKPGKDDTWQLSKGVVRRGESSVRTAIRTVSETLGIRGRVLEEAGRAKINSTRDGHSFSRRIIYYLMQQKGKEVRDLMIQFAWADFVKTHHKLSTVQEKRILHQARSLLAEWQKQEQNSL